ncbi:MAG: ABC transporter permease [Deltaproteobacteria bacterium]|nr:ABC transporter permease [Deltaproteobacteria bacterium]
MMERGGFLGMCLAEWRKATGRGLAWAILLFGMLHGIVAVAMLALGREAETRFSEQAVDSLTWLVAGELAVSLAAMPVNGLALLLLFAMIWAEDFSLGTIAMVFVRPVPRWRVFAAKATVAMGAALESMFLALLTGMLLGLPFFGLEGDLSAIGPDTPFIGWMGSAEGSLFLPVFGGVITGAAVTLPALGCTAMLAALTRSPVLTLFGSMMVLLFDAGVAFVTTVWSGIARGACAQAVQKAGRSITPSELDNIECTDAQLPERIHDLTVWASRDFLAARGLPEFWSEAGASVGVTLGWSALFLALGLLLFVKRDVD